MLSREKFDFWHKAEIIFSTASKNIGKIVGEIMEMRQLGSSGLKVPVICFGTWAFGNDSWWGHQSDKHSQEALELALSSGANFIDTAPVYGRGHSEEVIGDFLKKSDNREKVIISTKLGLRWEGRSILHDLSKKRALQEIDDSRKRLKTDYIDLYQVHWPDPATPISEIASLMHEFFQKGIIKSIGVSNYSVQQMEEFMKSSPLHSLQPQYNMFVRSIEKEIIPFCKKHNISIITYAPLYSGILTGKFFFDNTPIPNDINRKSKANDFQEPRLSINKKALMQLKDIAVRYNKTLAQLAINWNFNQAGVTSAIVGIRNKTQLKDNLGSVGWNISSEDMLHIKSILDQRENDLGLING